MIAAIIALALLGAGWFALRWQEESRRLDLAEYLLSIPADEFEGPKR